MDVEASGSPSFWLAVLIGFLSALGAALVGSAAMYLIKGHAEVARAFGSVFWRRPAQLRASDLMKLRSDAQLGFRQYYLERPQDRQIYKALMSGENVIVKGEALCGKTSKDSPETAKLAEAIAAHLDLMKDRVVRRLPGFDRGVAGWDKQLAGLADMAKGEFTDKLYEIGKARGFANNQDVTLSWARRITKMVRHETALALAQTTSRETAELAAKIRELCRKIMRNPHAFG